MAFEIEFQHEIEELGITLDIWAEYSNSGGGSDEPAYGPECQSITAVVVDENAANDEDIWDGLAELYASRMSRKWVWVQGDNWWHVEDAHSGLRADMAAIAILPRKVAPRKWELDDKGRQYVYTLDNLQCIIQERADENAVEAEMEGAGGPDPDELHDRLQDEMEE